MTRCHLCFTSIQPLLVPSVSKRHVLKRYALVYAFDAKMPSWVRSAAPNSPARLKKHNSSASGTPIETTPGVSTRDVIFEYGGTMLETIIVIVLLLWLVGMISGSTFGGVLHTLLLVALVVFIIRLLTGRRAV